jgi:hypothetical protein
MFSIAGLSLAAGKMHENQLFLSPAVFGIILQNHRWPPVTVSIQNRRFKVFEAGYWKDYQN